MNYFKRKILPLLKKKRYSIPAAIILVIILLIINGSRAKKPAYETRVANRMTVEQSVSVTGKVKSAEAVDLAFERGGKLAATQYKVGDKVNAGATVAHLSNADLAAGVESAEAALNKEIIKLSQMQTGARPEAVAVSGAELQSAGTSLKNAEFALADKVNDAFAKADDAVHNSADKLFDNPDTSPSFGQTVVSAGVTYQVDTNDINLRLLIDAKRKSVAQIFKTWSPVGSLESGNILSNDAHIAEQNLVTVQDLLNSIATAINPLSSNDVTTNAVYQSYQTDIATARTSVNTALTNLRTAIQVRNAAQSALDLASKQNTLNTAPSSFEDLKIQQAGVDAAKANVDSAQAELMKSIIVAPVSGIITKINFDPGEIVAANTPAVSIISQSTLQIEAFIPEADIAKVAVSQTARVTFDAYGNDLVLMAHVISIDPAETIIDGVPTYKTVLAFDNLDDRIKSGMTANVDVQGQVKNDVIAVPSRSITTRDNQKYIQVLVNGVAEERTVTTGLRGSDGNTEITSGLSAGDTVITSQPK